MSEQPAFTVIALGETNVEAIDHATHYSTGEGQMLVIRRRDQCPVCNHTLTVYCDGGRYADFVPVHAACAKTYYDEHGRPPKGFGMAITEGTKRVVQVGLVEPMLQILQKTPRNRVTGIHATFA
jgi:hypothetical protein